MSKKTIAIIIIVIFSISGILVFSTPTENIKESNNNKYNDDVIENAYEQVIKSKNMAYLDTIVGYINDMRIEVNEAKNYKLFDKDVLYLIPAGEGKCITQERGGTSTYSDTWEYLYIGVTYDDANYSYNYYAIALDSAGKGIDFLELSYNTKYDNVKNKNELLSTDFKKMYSFKTNVMYKEKSEGTYHSFSEIKGLKELASISKRNKILVISSCKSY